jgi:hypothetical protein
MADWKNFVIARTRSDGTPRQWIELRRRSAGYDLRLVVRDDGGSVRYLAWHTIADDEHYVEVLVRHASSESAADGLVAWWVDGVLAEQVAALDLYDADKRPNNGQFGAVLGVDVGTLGMLYLDEVVLREGETEIGPLGDTPPLEPTNTQAATSTAKATLTPTPDAGTGAVVEVRHELDLGEYDRLVGGDVLRQSAAAALAGTAGGLEVPLVAETSRYGEAQFASLTVPAFHWRFYLDPNSIEMVNWRNFIIARTRSGWMARQWVGLRYRDGFYELQLVLRDDNGVLHYSAYHVISDAEHYVEVSVRHASGDAADDGLAELWVDGTRGPTLGSLDLFDAARRPDNLQIGAVAGVDAGTLGTLYLDELLLRAGDAEIGPVLP